MSKKDLFPNNIRLLRYWRNKTQHELADALVCSQTTVCQDERGFRRIPLCRRKAYAAFLEVHEDMIDSPVTIILKAWERLVSDPRMPILVEELLSYDSKRLSNMVHAVSERADVHNFAL